MTLHGERRLTWNDILGPCGFYAAFGRPGSAIEAWLLENNFDLALKVEPARDDRSNFYGPPLPCITGDVAACSAHFLGRATSRGFSRRLYNTETAWPRGVIGVRFSWGRRPAMLADLAREFGPARFARFWGSGRDVETAFVDAFGLSSGEWVARWAARYRPPQLPEHAPLRGSSVAFVLVFAIVVSAGGLALASRRQVA